MVLILHYLMLQGIVNQLVVWLAHLAFLTEAGEHRYDIDTSLERFGGWVLWIHVCQKVEYQSHRDGFRLAIRCTNSHTVGGVNGFLERFVQCCIGTQFVNNPDAYVLHFCQLSGMPIRTLASTGHLVDELG